MFEATLFQDRAKNVVNGIVLGFMADVPGLIVTLRLTWVDVGRKRQEGDIKAINPSSPIPSIPHSLHAVHSCRSPCAPPPVSLHIQGQRCLSRQPPQLSEHSVAVNSQLGGKLIVACLYSTFPVAECLIFHGSKLCVLPHPSGCLDTAYPQHTECHPVQTAAGQGRITSENLNIFRCAEPGRGLLKNKKKPLKNSLQFFESRKCVRGRKVHVINVFHCN